MKVWIIWLRFLGIVVVLIAAYLIYYGYQDLTWTSRAIAEAGPRAYTIYSDEIVRESTEHNRRGEASVNTGLLLFADGMIMAGIAQGLSALRRKLER